MLTGREKQGVLVFSTVQAVQAFVLAISATIRSLARKSPEWKQRKIKGQRERDHVIPLTPGQGGKSSCRTMIPRPLDKVRNVHASES